MNVALAIPLLLVAVAQAMDQPAPSQSRLSTPAVDLTPSTTNTVTPSITNSESFAKLFVGPTLTQAAAATQSPVNSDGQKRTPRVVCGMVLIPANPAVDPKIVVPPSPQDANAHIRRIVPDTCVE